MNNNENKVTCSVNDLGMAAFLKMSGYELLQRRGREFDFIIEESEQEEFNKQKIFYINSQFCSFDNEIMALKKL